MSQSRLIAVKLLNKFYNNNSTLDEIFNDYFSVNELYSNDKKLSKSDKNLITELVYGVVRWQLWIDKILEQYIQLSKTRPAILNILRMTLYQLFKLDKIPNYACVNTAVEITKIIYSKNFEPLSKFVNGVLQAIIKDIKNQKDFCPTLEDPLLNLSIQTSHPE